MGTESEVERHLLGALGRRAAAPHERKADLLHRAEAAGLGPAALGWAVAAVTDHPWSLTLASCGHLDDLVRVWPAVAEAGSRRNRAVLRAGRSGAVLVERSTVDGAAPELVEDLFVVGLVAGVVERSLGTPVGHELLEDRPDGRLWRLVPTQRTGAVGGERWGATGGVSSAVLGVLATEPALGVGGTAAALGLSPRTLQRRLTDERTTFQQVRSRARLAGAARAALAGRSLTEAAHEAGFADSAHLSRDFRRLVGVRAQDWRDLSLDRSGRLARSSKPGDAPPP